MVSLTISIPKTNLKSEEQKNKKQKIKGKTSFLYLYCVRKQHFIVLGLNIF